MKRNKRLLILLISGFQMTTAFAQYPSLTNDDGPGSFRWACEQGGARIIVFNVSGSIRLSTPVVIRAHFFAYGHRENAHLFGQVGDDV